MINYMGDLYNGKKMTSQLRVRENIFVSKWKKWVIYDTV